MSSLPVKPPQSARIPRPYIALAVLLFAAGLAASIGAGGLIRVTVDGTSRRVASGTMVAELARAGYLTGRAGNVLARSGAIARKGGGMPAQVYRNGRAVGAEAVVYDGDSIVSVDGGDVVEGTVVRDKPIPSTTEFVGSGPLLTVESSGSVGVRRVEAGAISGEEVSSTVVTQPTPMVLKRYGARPGERVVALTFDDGPWPGQTERILSILKKYDVHASFFMIGYLAKRNAPLALKVAEAGQLIGDHTYGHQTLTELSTSAADQQIEYGKDAIAKSTGATPTWFRPPGGDISPEIWAHVNHANLRVALWNVDPQDWRRPTPVQIVANVVAHTRPGSIVLLHDGGGNRESTIKALPVIIKTLRSRGYKFVTLDGLPER